MLISEITVYDFLKEKIKLSESDARKYAQEMSYAEERLHIEVKEIINAKFKESDYISKTDLDLRIAQLETKIEKGFKEVIIWVIGAMIAIGGLSIAIIKLF